MAILERTYTVPLRLGFRNTPKYYRTNKAVSTLRAFLVRHMKASDSKIRLGQELNELLWKHGIKNPPPRVTIVAKKLEDGTVTAELVGKEYKGVVKPQAVQEQAQGLKGKLQAAMNAPKGEAVDEEKPAEPEKKAAPKKAAKKAAPSGPKA